MSQTNTIKLTQIDFLNATVNVTLLDNNNFLHFKKILQTF